MSHEDYLLSIQQRIVSTAQDMLDGKINFIIGSQVLSSLRHQIPSFSKDPDFDIFIVIHSETDHLPLGDVQKYWDKDVIAKLQPEIQDAEIRAIKQGKASCEAIVRRFGTKGNGVLNCPCCGNRTISEPDSYEICEICRWEDDPVQLSDPDYSGGANHISLNQARARWLIKSEK
jgi:hypothetical protein